MLSVLKWYMYIFNEQKCWSHTQIGLFRDLIQLLLTSTSDLFHAGVSPQRVWCSISSGFTCIMKIFHENKRRIFCSFVLQQLNHPQLKTMKRPRKRKMTTMEKLTKGKKHRMTMKQMMMRSPRSLQKEGYRLMLIILKLLKSSMKWWLKLRCENLNCLQTSTQTWSRKRSSKDMLSCKNWILMDHSKSIEL